VDLDAGRLVVRQQRVQVDAVVVTNHAKTDHGQDRRVTLDATAVRALQDWRTQQDRERAVWSYWRQDEGWVFTYDDGLPLNPYYISDVCRKLVAQAGLPHLTFHGLRHEHASLLLSAGVPITAVSKRLGHASAAITSDLYSHLLNDADRQMADAVESVLGASDSTAHTSHTQQPRGHQKGLIIQQETLF
jgi:integrase